MNIYCKIETQEDYDYFFQYDPDENIHFPCLFNIDTDHLSYTDGGVGILMQSRQPVEKNAKWVTVEEMKSQIFIYQLTL